VYALTDERQLAEHSLRVDLSTVTSDGVLVRKTLPGHEELGPLLCEELTIVFRGLLPSSQLPGSADNSADGSAVGSSTPPLRLPLATAATDLVLSILKSIERPREDVPVNAIHARCEASSAPAGGGPGTGVPPAVPGGGTAGGTAVRGGLRLDATIEQYELLWRIWKENISKPGRIAAGALGVWGMLVRNDKTKYIALEIAPLVARIRLPAMPATSTGTGGSAEAESERTLAVLHATRFKSSVMVMQEHEQVAVNLTDLGFDLHEPRPAASATDGGVRRAAWMSTSARASVRTVMPSVSSSVMA
jgi:hypothetical protein